MELGWSQATVLKITFPWPPFFRTFLIYLFLFTDLLPCESVLLFSFFFIIHLASSSASPLQRLRLTFGFCDPVVCNDNVNNNHNNNNKSSLHHHHQHHQHPHHHKKKTLVVSFSLVVGAQADLPPILFLEVEIISIGLKIIF